MKTATTYSPVTYDCDFNWYHHGPYEAFIKSLASSGLDDRIQTLRAKIPYFPERLIEEVNLLIGKGIEPREAIKQFDDQSESPVSTITEGVWPGIAGIVMNDDSLKEYVFVLGFPDGSRGLLRKQAGVVLSEGQRAWVSLTDIQGLYEPLGRYDAGGRRVG